MSTALLKKSRSRVVVAILTAVTACLTTLQPYLGEQPADIMERRGRAAAHWFWALKQDGQLGVQVAIATYQAANAVTTTRVAVRAGARADAPPRAATPQAEADDRRLRQTLSFIIDRLNDCVNEDPPAAPTRDPLLADALSAEGLQALVKLTADVRLGVEPPVSATPAAAPAEWMQWVGDVSRDSVELNRRLEQKEPAVYERCLLYTSPSPRDMRRSRMPSSA